MKMRCTPSDHADLERNRLREDGGHDIEERREDEIRGEQRVGARTLERRAKRHRHMLPAVTVVFQKDLDVAADALDAHVQAEHGLERDCKDEQRQESGDGQRRQGRGRNRQRAPADQAGQEYPDPRGSSRADGVTQGLEFFDCTRRHGVSTPPLRFRDLEPIHWITERERRSFLHNSWRKNCLVLMRLSARMPLIVMNRTTFWIGALALAGVLGAGSVPAEAAAAKKKDGEDDAGPPALRVQPSRSPDGRVRLAPARSRWPARWPSRRCRVTRWTRAATWCPICAPPPRSCTTRKRIRFSGKRTRAASDRSRASPR